MFTSATNVEELIRNFRVEDAMFRYSSFVPRLYNLCKSLGFEPGKMLPSRAFCSDENQGYPIIVITKHFGTFPFSHGRGGAVVATDRHGPFAQHGKDLVIIQASHVGYDPETHEFGTYSRIHAEECVRTTSCGKLSAIVSWYQEQYRFAQHNILVERCDGEVCLSIDNDLLRSTRREGLFLNLTRMVQRDADGNIIPLHTHSTSKSFAASEALQCKLADPDLQEGERIPMGSRLTPDLFFFRRELDDAVESLDHQESSLINPMPWIVTSPTPLLTAAQINTQIEFDRAFRTVAQAPSFRGKNVFYISGLNIDISPQPTDIFPTTKFVPWAAYSKGKDGSQRIIEQRELIELLHQQTEDNPDQIELDTAIHEMSEARVIRVDTHEHG
ncbi:MAG: hypothetical protein AMJ69_09035 [Gammaproteobacteria bacterium SG8_47]|nr:MAG: hypothetical protein AMJ69_09035 [Gammaproteobacteria bacterium SG8_47]